MSSTGVVALDAGFMLLTSSILAAEPVPRLNFWRSERIDTKLDHVRNRTGCRSAICAQGCERYKMTAAAGADVWGVVRQENSNEGWAGSSLDRSRNRCRCGNRRSDTLNGPVDLYWRRSRSHHWGSSRQAWKSHSIRARRRSQLDGPRRPACSSGRFRGSSRGPAT